MSPARMAWNRFWRKPGVPAAALLLLLLYVAAAAAPFLSPCDPRRPADGASWHPPNVSFVDGAGRVRPNPVARAFDPATDASGRRGFAGRIGADAPLRWFTRGDPWTIELPLLPALHFETHLFGTDPGAPRPFLLGADQRGRDLFARVIHGAQVSLTIGVVGVAISFMIGMVIGGLAGWLGGAVDELLMRLCEVLLLLPGFYVLLALRGALPDTTHWSSTRVYVTVVAIVSALWWAGLARAVRGQVLQLRELDHVQAARALGAGTLRIVVRHLLPGTLSFAIVAATLSIPGYVLMESALSMLGLGIQEPEPSWGNLLADATHIAQVAEHPWVLAPGFFLCAAVLAFNVVGDGLRDALDPRDRA